MELVDLFTKEHIFDVLKSTFSLSDTSETSFSVDKWKSNENFLLLDVKMDNVNQKYLLAKIPENFQNKEQLQLSNSKVLYPVFILTNQKKECYGAYGYQHGMAHFVSPEQNDVDCLKIILQNLAEHQASDLTQGEEIQKPSEYNLENITTTVTDLDFFKDSDPAIMKQSIHDLQLALNKLIESSNLFVRSVGCPFAKNVFVNQPKNKTIFLNVYSSKIIPPAYDALMYIFALSDEQFRQKYFEDLIAYYFDSLTKSLEDLKSSVAEKVTRNYSEDQIRVLLPVIKFKIVNSFLKLKKTSNLEGILTNILYFLKYPLINKEDIYETAKNKIESSEFDLLDYKLVCLSENNGHLGEYFHLDIKVKINGKEEILQLFAKIITGQGGVLASFVKNGPAAKEDFMYKKFFPLCAKNGLKDLLDFAPKCYLSRINWLLVLDDLGRQGYVGLKPNKVLNYDGLKASIVKLAEFHSCTIILEEILSKDLGAIVRLDKDYAEFLGEHVLIYEEGHPLQNHHDKKLELFYFILEKFPEITEKLNGPQEELRARFKKVFMSVFSKVKKSDTIRNVINHGDMYVANVLYKFDENNLITKGMLIDFQLLRYAPPTYELFFFLFQNSYKETRDKYLNILINDYYECVAENIRKFDLVPEEVFPKKLFDENIDFMKSAGMIGALHYAVMIHIDPDFREEIFHDQEKFFHYLVQNQEELVNISLEVDHYKNILKGFVEDIVDIINKEF